MIIKFYDMIKKFKAVSAWYGSETGHYTVFDGNGKPVAVLMALLLLHDIASYPHSAVKKA